MKRTIYSLIRNKITTNGQPEQYSSGVWPEKVRKQTVTILGKKRGSLLDAGCGEGILDIKLAKENPQLTITAVDSSDERLAQLRENANREKVEKIKTIKSDITSIDTEANQFDYAACINTLFNLNSLDQIKLVLKEIARLLKPNGTLIIDFRNHSNVLVRLKYFTAPLYDKTIAAQGISLKTYSLQTITKVLNDAGFKITQTIPLGILKNNFAPIIMIEAKKC